MERRGGLALAWRLRHLPRTPACQANIRKGEARSLRAKLMDNRRPWRARRRRPLAVAALAVALPLTGALLAGPAFAGTGGTSTTPPFNECPAVGGDTSCAVLLIIEPDGAVTVHTDSSQ